MERYWPWSTTSKPISYYSSYLPWLLDMDADFGSILELILFLEDAMLGSRGPTFFSSSSSRFSAGSAGLGRCLSSTLGTFSSSSLFCRSKLNYSCCSREEMLLLCSLLDS